MGGSETSVKVVSNRAINQKIRNELLLMPHIIVNQFIPCIFLYPKFYT